MDKMFFLFLLVLLSGCKGGGEHDQENTITPPLQSPFSALNGLVTVKANTETMIDLKPYVVGEQSQFSVTHISSNNPNRCFSSVSGELTFDVTLAEPGRCDFTYSVSNAQGINESAKIVVVSSEAINPELPPISVPVVVGAENVDINLADKLGDVIQGYTLSPELVIQVSPGSLEGVATVEGDQRISYQVPRRFGWNYIGYTLTNASGNALVGYIFVSIADDVNSPPSISNRSYQYPKILQIATPTVIDLGEFTVANNFSIHSNQSLDGQDLYTLPDATPEQCAVMCLSDPSCTGFEMLPPSCTGKNGGSGSLNEGSVDVYKRLSETGMIIYDRDEWQLSDVQSINATVTPVDPNDISNKKFTITTAKTGTSHVSYIVSDHRGGYSLGLMQFESGCSAGADRAKLMSLIESGAIQEVEAFDTSCITDMSYLFANASAFNGDISRWDTSKVTNMDGLFYGSAAFNRNLPWDTSNVTNMNNLFYGSTAFNGDISGWDTSKVTTMDYMFASTRAFNGDISRWDTSKVTTMNKLFDSASAFNGDISGWNTSNVTNMTYMFATTSFNGDISRWDTSKVTNMQGIFVSSTFNGDISGWNTSNVTNMNRMFYQAYTFNGDISGWDTSKVTNMALMFFSASAFNGDISGWNVGLVTDWKNFSYDANENFTIDKHPKFK